MSLPNLKGEQQQQQKRALYVPQTPLEKHCAFFDRNRDGLLTPSETFTGFRSLGFNLFLSLIGTLFIHVSLSYPTLDSWVPDPFFTIHLKNIHRCKHGSDTDVYERDGSIRPERLDHIVALYGTAKAPGARHGIGFVEGVKMLCGQRNTWDWFGWIAAALEWAFLFVLCADHGVVPVEAIAAQYDGTLFYQIEARRKERVQ